MVSNYVNFTVKCAKRSKDLRNETLNKSSRVQQRFGISPEVWCHHVYLRSHRQHPMAKLRCIVSPLFAAVDLRHFTHLEAICLPSINITKNRWKHQSIILSPFQGDVSDCPKRDKLSSQKVCKEEQRFQVIQLHRGLVHRMLAEELLLHLVVEIFLEFEKFEAEKRCGAVWWKMPLVEDVGWGPGGDCTLSTKGISYGP